MLKIKTPKLRILKKLFARNPLFILRNIVNLHCFQHVFILWKEEQQNYHYYDKTNQTVFRYLSQVGMELNNRNHYSLAKQLCTFTSERYLCFHFKK